MEKYNTAREERRNTEEEQEVYSTEREVKIITEEKQEKQHSTRREKKCRRSEKNNTARKERRNTEEKREVCNTSRKRKKEKKKIFIQMKYIWFYNVCILIVKSFIPTKI